MATDSLDLAPQELTLAQSLSGPNVYMPLSWVLQQPTFGLVGDIQEVMQLLTLRKILILSLPYPLEYTKLVGHYP